MRGNWGLFSTLMNNADLVRLSGIPGDGYGGSAAQGALAYWILHSCAVIPTAIDATTTYDVWWNTFQGLHAALAYRTEMWINDEVTFRFAFFAGLGAPVNVYGHADDTIFPTTPLPRPSVLQQWWYGD